MFFVLDIVVIWKLMVRSCYTDCDVGKAVWKIKASNAKASMSLSLTMSSYGM